jgi:hypothetical protein
MNLPALSPPLSVRRDAAKRPPCPSSSEPENGIRYENAISFGIMRTLLTPCRVPWSISPSTSGLTLTHTEPDVSPECTVVLGGGRLQEDGRTDDRRIEITFDCCYFTRTGPHSDLEGIESLGYEVISGNETSGADYLDRRKAIWKATGFCPDSGFYVATQSPWIESLPQGYREGTRHYIVYGRDGHVELIAAGFRWREWKWRGGRREDAPSQGPIIGEGAGAA